MNDFEEFIDTLSEATGRLVADIETAWQELKDDLREIVTVKYLRSGGIAYCKNGGKKYCYLLIYKVILINLHKSVIQPFKQR